MTSLLWPEQVAERAGVTVRAIRKMTSEAKKRRDAGTLRPYDLPQPAVYESRLVPRAEGLHPVQVVSPRYLASEIDVWLLSRPGKGHGLRAGEMR